MVRSLADRTFQLSSQPRIFEMHAGKSRGQRLERRRPLVVVHPAGVDEDAWAPAGDALGFQQVEGDASAVRLKIYDSKWRGSYFRRLPTHPVLLQFLPEYPKFS